MFTAALFTIARTWTQPKHPSTEEWVKKMCCIHTHTHTHTHTQIYNGISLSHKKEQNNEIMPSAAM